MSASIMLKGSLVLDVLALHPGGVAQQVSVKLSRIEAQRLGATLQAFAIGSTTKSAGAERCDVFIAANASLSPAPSQATAPAKTFAELKRSQLPLEHLVDLDRLRHLR